MKPLATLLLAAALSLAARNAAAGPAIDGKRDLVCEPKHLAQCDEEAACASVAPEDVDLPPALRLSFKSRKLTAVQGERSSPIQSVQIEPAVVVVQGSQNGRGWSMVIDRATGSLSGTIADAEGAFVVAGTCSAP
ncbi:MAG TPA: hypothetical protein VEI82_13930 [Myxococcota bacterium]|nr:hypothetical protein [Myxococcota bacterium]